MSASKDFVRPARKQIRLKDYNYSQNGACFITICVEKRRSLLWDVGAIDNRPYIDSNIVQQFKSDVTKEIGFPVWQKSFYEHVIRGEQDYLTIWQYVDDNPAKWAEDEYFHEINT